ncbi:MAG TPA: hypothetical protein PKC18_06230, partial [Lacipirellulaceae bacterium]|nr:hypothetical protein [Lacipirellulaceae bacterium]
MGKVVWQHPRQLRVGIRKLGRRWPGRRRRRPVTPPGRRLSMKVVAQEVQVNHWNKTGTPLGN